MQKFYRFVSIVALVFGVFCMSHFNSQLRHLESVTKGYAVICDKCDSNIRSHAPAREKKEIIIRANANLRLIDGNISYYLYGMVISLFVASMFDSWYQKRRKSNKSLNSSPKDGGN